MSLNDIKRFLYVGPINILDFSKSDLHSNIFSIVETLINEKQSKDILNILNEYLSSYSNYVITNENSKKVHSNLDCVIYLLACCSKLSKEEEFTHKGFFLFF